MRSYRTQEHEKSPIPVELLGETQHEAGLTVLPSHERIQTARRLMEKGLVPLEKTVAIPWLVKESSEEGMLTSQESDMPLNDLIAESLGFARSTISESTIPAEKRNWVEREVTGCGSDRVSTMTLTRNGRNYLRNHPQLVANVAFVVMTTRREFAKEVWGEIHSQNAFLERPTEPYLGDGIENIGDLNSYVKNLRLQQSTNMDDIDMKEGQLPQWYIDLGE